MIIYTTYQLVSTVLSREDVPYQTAFFITTAYCLACVFGFIITFFFIFHLWLISNSYTTIEFCEKRGSSKLFRARSPYDLGVYSNFKSALGENPFIWFVPCGRNLEGEGLYFEIDPFIKESIEQAKS